MALLNASNPIVIPNLTMSDEFRTWTLRLVRELVPEGGTTGQVLAKVSSDDFNLQWVTSGGGGVPAWGGIIGTLSDQSDLQGALDLKSNISSLATVATTGNYSDLSGAPTTVSSFTNDAGYLANLLGSTTTTLSEGANLYYTEARVSANTNVAANTAKISYTDAAAVALNTAKISYTDAAAVALNTAKVGAVYSFNKIIGTGTQAVTSTLAAITWSASTGSVGSDVSYSGANPTRLTAVSAGIYKVAGYATIQSTAQRAQAAVEIIINGTATGLQRSGSYIRNSGTGYDYWTMDVSSTPFTLAASDYVELAVGQVTGATYGYAGGLAINCDRAKSEFWIERVA